ncbi:GTPase activating protein [Schizosaccharomyces cryophilus OY26]|uniref:GTPase activating protein n=1 Tax=Schizosaccharomyces cryophilus (strain OY26 / ATCC MYA-4695 / CBS 11777 / NBRC 106824 / NRRL Y48691) TaxID=653667 RepID=S9W4M3_SCHCR|nr:GTPase activating protein [Schizosaccharomyces cryophilus OY26]EPY53469.1 GTPase activating protein [Schizosaccharomyces cryophilus OY26]
MSLGKKKETNAIALKSLLREPANKICADCKRNEQPRWASWSLGVFICIRCSGIHRSLGVHISRVKSVDLDAWTDEQTENMQRWGNQRANMYWEANLTDGHIPSDSKVATFIRTKYELRKWVLSREIPSPETLIPFEKMNPSISSPEPIAPGKPAAASMPSISKEPLRSQSEASMIDIASMNTSENYRLPNPGASSTASTPNLTSLSSNNTSTAQANRQKDLKSSILSLYASPRPMSAVNSPVSSFSNIPSTSTSTVQGAQQYASLQSPVSSASFVADKWKMPLFGSTNPYSYAREPGMQPQPPRRTQSAMDHNIMNTHDVWK